MERRGVTRDVELTSTTFQKRIKNKRRSGCADIENLISCRVGFCEGIEEVGGFFTETIDDKNVLLRKIRYLVEWDFVLCTSIEKGEVFLL